MLMVQNSGLKRRRFRVTVMYMGLAGWTIPSLVIGLPPLEDAIPSRVLFAVILFFATVGTVGFFVTAHTSTHVAHGLKADWTPRDKELDERQRTVWDRAIRKAYFVVSGFLLIFTGYWLFVWPVLRLPETEAMGLLSLALFLLALSLPNAVVAWIEPNAEREGDTP